jgi:RNA polymerase sigma factor (sigma-70 family)
VTTDGGVEGLLRELAPQVLGALVCRFGRFDAAEDAVQEALLAAAVQWPGAGLPDNPRAWLVTVASRRLTDQLRSTQARRRREEAVAARAPGDHWSAPAADADTFDRDDTLVVLLLCCHPALSPASQIALTLRAVGGLTTAEIARAFLVPEPTMGQRISRAKQQIERSRIPFRLPPPDQRDERVRAVMHVLYLMFTEGHTATTGEALQRIDLSAEAIRITRILQRLLPGNGEAAGLLALMLLTHARRHARTGADGALVPLAEQDRSRWDRDQIAEGVALVTAALAAAAPGPYQLQAAIAAVHAEAAHPDDTDWPQILGLYRLLDGITDNPMVTLNHAVAAAMVHGPDAGLAMLTALDGDRRIADHHRLAAVRGHLLELAGSRDAAVAHYRRAARRTTSLPERRYLELRATRLARARP